VDPREDNTSLNGKWFTGTFAIAGSGECHFIRLVNVGRNYFRDDRLCISAWKIFGSLIDTEIELSSHGRDPSSQSHGRERLVAWPR
jgi:hypothetical protein